MGAVPRLIVPATRCARVLIISSPLLKQRAQGMPDAGCTREPCVQKKCTFTHASNDRFSRTTGIPRAMVLRLIRDLLGAPGLLATVARGLVIRWLDPSVGGSGPHDFAVRLGIARQSAPQRPSLPAPTFVTTAKRPS